MDEKRLQEIEHMESWWDAKTARKCVPDLIAEIRRLNALVNEAELRGQDTGHALCSSTVRAWVKQHGMSGSAVNELLAGLT